MAVKKYQGHKDELIKRTEGSEEVQVNQVSKSDTGEVVTPPVDDIYGPVDGDQS